MLLLSQIYAKVKEMQKFHDLQYSTKTAFSYSQGSQVM